MQGYGVRYDECAVHLQLDIGVRTRPRAAMHVAFAMRTEKRSKKEQVEELESGGTTLSPALHLSLPQQRVGHLNRRVLGGTVDALRRWVTHRR